MVPGEDGVLAVEFALFAPVLFFALAAAVDVGRAEYERMTIEHTPGLPEERSPSLSFATPVL